MRPAVWLFAAALLGAAAHDPAPESILANANRQPAGRLKNGVLTLKLELRTGLFRPYADDGEGVLLQAFAETGRPLQIPGPLIRVPEGTVINAAIKNTLRDSTLVLYGLGTRPGRPEDTIQVAPRATRTVRFVAGEPGTYFYWGTTTGKQMGDGRSIDSQLHGALIVDSAGVLPHPDERVFVIGLWFEPADSTTGEPARVLMSINGKSWPHTERLGYTVGDSVRWRWINPTSSSHPMHLHGFYFKVASRGSWARDTIYPPDGHRRVVTELLWPGGTMSALWSPAQPGNWVFHCHFAFHVSSELYLATAASPDHGAEHRGHARHGMSGLVLGLNVKPAREQAGDMMPPPRRALRLVAHPGRADADSAHLFAYALEGGVDSASIGALSVPGPAIVLERGRPVRITVVNQLDEPTAVHWHGIELESYPDGVPDWSGGMGRIFRPIEPGDSFAAEFTPPRAGTFMYHSHFSEIRQILGGLYGPLIVVDPGTTLDTATNRIVMVGAMFRHDSAFGVINGRLDPEPIELHARTTYRLRLVNIGDARTRFVLLRPDSSAVPWRPVAKDGADLPSSQAVVSSDPFMSGPGEIGDFEFTPQSPGQLILDVESPFVPWRVPVPVHVLPEIKTASR
ncbi:MAG TPA: multicopper oxidase domain-containing protein [Gemmatimonadales bacterium]|jgi:FtsP/CotA-like multicopper oxidase with cupredoxin domain|nr:multicopper oxidase domain-containing protein [Gemmatimonadales bacterium]